MVALEILISRSYQNDSDENVCFPVVFPSRAVQFHENMDLSNPEHTETIHKNMIPVGFIPRCPACTGAPSGNSTYVFMHLSTVDMASDRCRVFGALCIYLPVFSNFVFCIRTYWFLMSSCCRKGGCCGCAGCIAGFLPNRSRLLSSFGVWNNVPSNSVRTCFGYLSFVVVQLQHVR